jgi:hypothetical protein
MMGPMDYPAMAGLLQQIAMDPRTKRGMGYPSPTEGAVPYRGGSTIRTYHGTSKYRDFDKFDLESSRHPKEQGVFTTPDLGVAKRYGSKVIPLDVKLSNAARVDYSKISPSGMYSPKKMGKMMDAARAKGKDILIVDNIIDMGGPQTQIIGLNPKGLFKNAKTGGTMFGLAAGLLGLGQDDQLD